jgi:anti-anti-sigma factor
VDILDIQNLNATVGIEAGNCLVVLKGTADYETRPELATWIRRLHDEALRLRLDQVVVDIRELEFMSSICVNVLVGWLVTIMELPPAQHYRVHFRWNRARFWQRKSLNALSRLAMLIVSTDPEIR